MKNLRSIIIILMLAKAAAYGQQTNLKRITKSDFLKFGNLNNYYVYDDNLNKFAGTWVGNSVDKAVRITFSKKGIRFNQTDNDELEILTGNLQYTEKGKLKANYGDDILHGSADNDKDILNIIIYVKSRKTQEALTATYLQDGTIKLEIGQPIYESRNDKDFEYTGSMILTKQ